MHVSPVQIDLNFVVDASDPLGITSLKGPGVEAVYMATSDTPATGNPDPGAGIIVIQLQDNYSRLFGMTTSIQSPESGSDVKIDNSAMTAGEAYVITTVGNATAAKWRAIGVPAGVTPAIGVSFIAATNGGAGNTLTSRVQTAAAAGSTVASIEITGDPNQTINPAPSANQGFGAQIILQCRDIANADVAPVDGTTIQVTLYLSNSSITIQGE